MSIKVKDGASTGATAAPPKRPRPGKSGSSGQGPTMNLPRQQPAPQRDKAPRPHEGRAVAAAPVSDDRRGGAARRGPDQGHTGRGGGVISPLPAAVGGDRERRAAATGPRAADRADRRGQDALD